MSYENGRNETENETEKEREMDATIDAHHDTVESSADPRAQLQYAEPEEMKSAFLTIWTKPKVTVRKLVNTNPRYMVILLVILSSVSGVLSQGLTDISSAMFALWLGLALVGGLVAGFIAFFFLSALYKWVGSWIDGQASHRETRTVYAWSNLPLIVANIILFLGVLILGPHVMNNPLMTDNAATAVITALVLLIQLALFIWSVVILVGGLSEVHRFSNWKAFATLLIIFLLLLVPFILLVVIIAGVIGTMMI
ncbi:Yip1 family protein [Caldalkalibacillus salinus]|uniref:Yip1 family protein n=1 Tax=Caldalkalibacillus salinus TaxID=2803787 RepID=UPI0019228643|nr:Yip1 family protein [Caldalkalibacillus salinus]